MANEEEGGWRKAAGGRKKEEGDRQRAEGGWKRCFLTSADNLTGP